MQELRKCRFIREEVEKVIRRTGFRQYFLEFYKNVYHQIPLYLFEMGTNILDSYVSSHNDYCVSRFDSANSWLKSASFNKITARLLQEDIIAFFACLERLLPFAPKVTCLFRQRHLQLLLFRETGYPLTCSLN
jgi:hypothetical protein